MSHRRLWTLLLVPLVSIPLLGQPVSAGILFGKKSKKPIPNDRVPELLAIVKTDGDEAKRTAAAEELRNYDPTAYPMIIPTLVDVLLSDQKPNVRAEAAQSLGKLRPVTQQAGMALEKAMSSDSSMRVRLQARSALLQYHWSGYQSAKKDELLLQQTKEPALADENVPAGKGPALAPTGRATPPPTMVPTSGSQVPSHFRPVPLMPVPSSPLAPRPSFREPPAATPPAGDKGPDLGSPQ
jgi:hypothetical protein